ncbi:MAG: serine/threonine protein kinase [Acidobacteria bacterium]|nr:serine/threonine protein kinase [Acidobacteriota bacterium]
MPSKLGRFELLSELSRSASGAVYKANDPSAARTIVLKTLRLELPQDLEKILVQIILREAEATKILSSQNIALLYGAGEIDKQFCAAMEYIEGNSLAAMIARQEGFSIWDLLDISRQVVNALDHASTRGVLHRGLEPEKIMMQWDGTVKILGYGVSTMVSAIPTEGSVPPLFYYMAPEQIKGEQMDVRSNIFTWGAILYEMVTDRKPFVGDDIGGVRQKILEETPEPPASINPRINLGVSRVIMQALSKSPEERYQHGHELMLDLERAKEPITKSAQSSPPLRKSSPSENSSPPAEEKPKGARAPLEGAGAKLAGAPKRAAAAAGVGSRGKSNRAEVQRSTSNQVSKVSAQSAAPVETAKPKYAVDPMMAEKAPGACKMASFSDLEEMPPLKEVYVPPQASSAVAEEPRQTEVAFSLPPRMLQSAEQPRPKIITGENVKKAMREIRKVPPRLVVYSAAAALALMLFMVIGMWLHIRHQNADSALGPQPQTASAEETKPTREQPGSPRASDVLTPSKPKPAVAPQFSAPKKKNRAQVPSEPVITPGQLTINSVPDGAQVQLDGHTDPAWLTPYTIAGLEPGQHSVSIAKSGYSSEARSVDISSGGQSVLVIHLTQLGATVIVSSQPSGAAVYIDGKNSERVTPAHISISERGTHNILVRKSGYLDETTTTALTPGQTFTYSPVLRTMGVTDDIKIVGKFNKLFGKRANPGMSKVSVKTQPKGAQVTANGRMVDRLTPVDFLLNPGNYVLEIALPGYKPVHRVVNVEEGSKVELNENLEPE